jgi:hypothetical protein
VEAIEEVVQGRLLLIDVIEEQGQESGLDLDEWCMYDVASFDGEYNMEAGIFMIPGIRVHHLCELLRRQARHANIFRLRCPRR